MRSAMHINQGSVVFYCRQFRWRRWFLWLRALSHILQGFRGEGDVDLYITSIDFRKFSDDDVDVRDWGVALISCLARRALQEALASAVFLSAKNTVIWIVCPHGIPNLHNIGNAWEFPISKTMVGHGFPRRGWIRTRASVLKIVTANHCRGCNRSMWDVQVLIPNDSALTIHA